MSSSLLGNAVPVTAVASASSSATPASVAPERGQCRICLDDDDTENMIAPCRCAGGSKYIHRSCLDHWRYTKHQARAFTHCGVCQFEYWVEPVADDAHAERRKRRTFRLFVIRDTVLLFLVVQAIIVVLGFCVRTIDHPSETLRRKFPDSLADHAKTTYYVCGLVLFLAILGFIGIIVACVSCCGEDEETEENDNRHRGRGSSSSDDCCLYCYIGRGGSASCDGCCDDCDCGDGCGEAMLVMVVVLVVLLAFVGIFVGIFAATAAFQKICQRHMRTLWLKQEVKHYVVVDFTHRELPPLPSAPAFEGAGDYVGPGSIQMEPIQQQQQQQRTYPDGLFESSSSPSDALAQPAYAPQLPVSGGGGGAGAAGRRVPNRPFVPLSSTMREQATTGQQPPPKTI